MHGTPHRIHAVTVQRRGPSRCVPERFLEDLVAALSAHADPERAVQEQRYLKSTREFFGVTVPRGRRIVAQLVAEHRVDTRKDTLAVAAICWAQEGFECRRAAVEVLVIGRERLGLDDLTLLESMVREGETWAIVDELAARVIGSIVERHPDGSGPTLDRWAADPDSFWLRRAALLALLVPLRDGGGDWERFTRYADAMMNEQEFFIRKAIGWILRDTSRKRPELVRAWVEPRRHLMSGVTRREAMKYL